MKLWLLTQNTNNGWDTHDGCVVAAKTEADARKILPDEHMEWGTNSMHSWVDTPEEVTVQLLGNAVKGTEAGLILGSFNAG